MYPMKIEPELKYTKERNASDVNRILVEKGYV